MNNNAAILDQRPATSDQNSVLVSIIIPAYNTAEYIHRAIESSIRQTHSNIEIIIIDDGSTDNTLEIAKKYAEKDSRIRVIHQDNGGVSSARNHGMREANAEYYVFLDSDDWLEDDAVEVLLDAQTAHPDKLIAANYYYITPDHVKRIASDESIQSCTLSIKEAAESHCGIWKEGFDITCFRGLCIKIFRADICRMINFHEGMIYSEDALFVINYLYSTGGAFYISKPLMNIFLRPGSATRSMNDPETARRSIQSQIKSHEMTINHPKNTPEVRKLMLMSRTIRIMYYIDGVINGTMDKSGWDIANKCMREATKEFMSRKEIPLRKKLAFILKMYLPLPVSTAIFRSWGMLKRIRDKMRRK